MNGIDGFDESVFDFSKASEFSDSQILEYWVDISGSGLLDLLKPMSVKPMMLLGGKGSGKTHLMRYCSGSVQRLMHDGSLAKSIKKNKYLGVYAGADGTNVDRFSGKGIAEEVWERVFSYYFDLWLSIKYLDHIQLLVEEGEVREEKEVEICEKVKELFDMDIGDSWGSILAMKKGFLNLIREIDFSSNNSALTGDLGGLRIKSTPGRLIYGLPDVVSNALPIMNEVRVCYLIDEIENFTEEQQKYLNTLIRYRSGVATLKVGTRLYGVKTWLTRGAGEPIKQGSEYERRILDSYLRDSDKQYSRFIRDMMIRRLRKAGIYLSEAKSSSLDELFEKPDSGKFYQSEALDLLSSFEPLERPYFERIRSEIKQIYGGHSIDDVDFICQSVVANLSFPDYPVLEKVNILHLYRDWGSGEGLLEKSARINILCSQYLEQGKAKSKDYAAVVDHYAQDMLAQLYRDCGKRPIYAGLETLISLSQGIPRNFLEIMRNIYIRSRFFGDSGDPFFRFSIKAQSEGVRDAAAWFWDDAQPDCFGYEVREAVDRLAELMRSVRYSSRPSECSLVAFSLKSVSEISPEVRKIIEHSVNWSFLIPIRDGRSNKNSETVDDKYRIAPMLAPKWGLPEGSRGALEIDPALITAMFSSSPRHAFQSLLEKRVAGMNAPYFGKPVNVGQKDLF